MRWARGAAELLAAVPVPAFALAAGFLLLAANPRATRRPTYLAIAALAGAVGTAGVASRIGREERSLREELHRALANLQTDDIELLASHLALPPARQIVPASQALTVNLARQVPEGTAVVIAAGRISSAARKALSRRGVRLLDRQGLGRLLSQGGTGDVEALDERLAALADAVAPACPQCGGGMVRRTAQGGPNPGSEFWGCARYPACKGAAHLGGRRFRRRDASREPE